MFTPCTPTATELDALQVARVGFMAACPFYSHLYISTLEEVFTRDIPTLATDGRHVIINPAYLASLKPAEAVFALAHEVFHFVCRHPQRMKSYNVEGNIDGTPFDAQQFNIAADYVVNASLMEQGVGMMNTSWLYDANTTGEDLVEDVYKRIYKKPPQGGGAQPGRTYGQSGKAPKGAIPDKTAAAQGGGFDQLLEPPRDPVTGGEQAPDESEFKEAIARAFGAAKAMGSVHASISRMVEEILAPQINWREHIRLLMTGHMGARGETWDRPNRRRLLLNPLVIMPGRRGYGADTVAIGVDTSGSIGEKELAACFAEIAGVLTDVRPRQVMLLFCDAKVHRVDSANNLDELAHIRAKGAPGGGGTSFIPVFDRLAEDNITPDTLLYITDGYGRFPYEAPKYPVVWCMTTDVEPPFGETVRIEV